MNMIKKVTATAVLAGVFMLQPAAVQAQATATPTRVLFAKGTTSKVIKGTIKGDRSRLYVVNVRAGQKLTVKMTTSNASSYFNITAPGAAQALHIGSAAGNNFTGIIPSSGDYTIDVFLMRNAARRNETANFTLTVAATGR